MENRIKCPNCGIEINIDQILFQKAKAKLERSLEEQKRALEEELDRQRKKLLEQEAALAQERAMLAKKEEYFEQQLNEAVAKELKAKEQALYAKAKQELAKEQQMLIDELKKELEQKRKESMELQKAKMQIESLRIEKEQAAMQARLQMQQELGEKLQEERAKLEQLTKMEFEQKLKQIQEQFALEQKQKEEQMAQLKHALEEARSKAQQGSQQLQGEALELTIESWLKEHFREDRIEEVKKGAFGADCIQYLYWQGVHCGTICYESKNAKHFNSEWIAKLKQDMLRVKADIGVLVTTAYPNGMDRMGWVDGVWVCSLEEFKGSVALLRHSLIRIHQAVQKEENKSDKMVLLYNYLTSSEFQMQLNAIVDGFMRMQSELDKERRSLMASWKRRQKLIDNVLTSTTEMYGALQAIAGGAALPKIEALELKDDEED